MEYRKLGASDLKVSVLGFGAWGIGGPPFWDNEGDAASLRSIIRAYDLGINFFDTAPVYGFGHSEQLLGRALKPFRDKVIIATKCGLTWDREQLGSIRKRAGAESIKKEIEASLQRLQTDYIDLYQVHWPDADTPQEETMRSLLDLQAQGKIRCIGVSNYNVEQMEACLRIGPLVSLQPEFSLLQRRIEKDLQPFCRQNNISIIAYSPLASGVLTGKYDRHTRFKDWRGKGILGEFTGEAFQKNVAKVERLQKLTAPLGRTCGQIALNWVIRQPGIASALTGVKTESQVEENLAAVGWSPPPPDADRIEAIFAPV
ncbi:MAG: aldo/keto reductase [Nitrospinaceae bacterium]